MRKKYHNILKKNHVVNNYKRKQRNKENMKKKNLQYKKYGEKLISILPSYCTGKIVKKEYFQ